jgi:5-methylcytosine-specific restriction endonuclease McrA
MIRDWPLSTILDHRWQRIVFRHLLWSIDPHCLYCTRRLRPKGVTLDHVLPICRGGAHHVDNMVLACPACNVAKGERTPSEWLTDLQRACERLKGANHGNH